jgi:hypothetical protein
VVGGGGEALVGGGGGEALVVVGGGEALVPHLRLLELFLPHDGLRLRRQWECIPNQRVKSGRGKPVSA